MPEGAVTMDDAALKKYLAEDYAKAVQFYDASACSSKRWYRGLSIYLITVAALLTPIVVFAPDDICWRIFSALLSTTIVIATALLTHLKCHENWLSYRNSWDALARERRLFETGTGIYKSAADKGALFVEQVESILANEGADFYARHAKSEEPAKAPEK